MSRLLIILVIFQAMVGCDGESKSRSDSAGALLGDGSADGSAAPLEAGAPDSTLGAEATPSFGSGTHFGSAKDFFAYVNEKRESYANHKRWAGFPFSGGHYHTNVTWPYTMKWSDKAAAAAQAEADAVAGGGAPCGKKTFANPGQLPIYIDGVNSTTYTVGGRERPGSFTTEACTLCNSNPFMRMGVFYHDPGGEGPVLTRVGVGAADMGNGDTWWVIRFAPEPP